MISANRLFAILTANKIAEQVITLLENHFSGLHEDIKVIDVSTLHTWECYMEGSQGFDSSSDHHEYFVERSRLIKSDFFFYMIKKEFG